MTERTNAILSLNNMMQEMDLENIAVRSKNFIDFNVERGMAIARNLLNRDEVSIAESFMSAGAVFPYHKHQLSREILIVYKGIISVICEGCGDEENHKVLEAGDYMVLEPGIGHLIKVKEDAKVIAVAIPADPIFPK